MFTEPQREYMRNALLEAMADYTRTTGGGTDESAIINTAGYEYVVNSMNCQQTRPRGTAKENCSPDVFEHLKLLRALNSIPTHFQKWIKYRYGNTPSIKLAADLIEIAIGDLEYFAGRPQKVKALGSMVEKLVISRREFSELQQKDICDAMNVNRSTFFRTYREHCEKTNEYLDELDKKAIDFMLVSTGHKKT